MNGRWIRQRGSVGVGEDGAIVAGRKQELVGEVRREGVRLAHLSFIRRLRACGVEDWVKEAGLCGLNAFIYLGVDIQVVALIEIEIDATVDQPFRCQVRCLPVEDPGIGIIRILRASSVVPSFVVVVENRLVHRRHIGVAVVSEVAIWRVSRRCGAGRAQNCSLPIRAGSVHRPNQRDDDVQAFVIDEAEDLVLLIGPPIAAAHWLALLKFRVEP